MSYKLCKVVALPSEDRATSVVFADNDNTTNRRFSYIPIDCDPFYTSYRDTLNPYHFYIISDDNIAEGDLVYNGRYCFRWSYEGWVECPDFEGMKVFRIIASTDESLGLPLIPIDIIKSNSYINTYGFCLVEYYRYNPKVKSTKRRKYIDASKVKNNFNTEEVFNMLRQFYNEYENKSFDNLVEEYLIKD